MHPFARTATQRHHQRSEHWVVLEGTAVVWRGDEVLTVGAEEDVRIPPGVPHVLLNGGASPLSVIEIQVGDDLSDGDTERLPAPMEVELCPSMP
jgi:mannose-6-phosphate isomerase-like protein (cupin superfamily)